jgi:hypothetical protein
MPAIGRNIGRKASVEVRQDLLRFLDPPVGTVVIARRPTPDGDVLVVRTSAPNVLPPHRRPSHFQGFVVNYETVPPIKAGRW